MFKEIGERLTKGTINLSITQKDGMMSVIVSFKDVPGLTTALFTGKPEEIDEVFFEKLEQPMETVSKFNFDMEAFNKAVEEEAVKKGLRKAEKDKKDKAKAEADKSQTKIEASVKGDKKEPEKKVIRMTEKQKEEVVLAGLGANSGDEIPKAVSKIEHLKSVTKAEAQEYFDNNIKSDFEKALEQKKHLANVEAMKEEAETVEEVKTESDEDEFDPFSDDDDFQL